MGQQYCIQDKNVIKDTQLNQQITEGLRIHDYYQSDWPEDKFALQKINELRNNSQEFDNLLKNNKVMKHKFLDKYYIGEWQNGGPGGLGILLEPDYCLYYGQHSLLPHGKGVFISFKNRFQYEGQIKKGKGQGQGKITSFDNKYIFEGVLQNSYLRAGVLTLKFDQNPNKNCRLILNNYPEGKSIIDYNDGRHFEGYINRKTFAPHGEGTVTFPDKSEYNGNWQDGEMHGYGVFKWQLSQYEGHYQHGKKHGQGKFTFPSGKIYEGCWVDGKQDGKGILKDKTGNIIHKGVWQDGVFLRQQE